MNLVWKLLRSHISIGQFLGFFFANLFGMAIVLLGIQFYSDILPVFTQEDSFMKANYVVISKRIGTGSTISGNTTSFTVEEEKDLMNQPFIESLSRFTSTSYKVDAQMGINGKQILSSELFFESVADEFVDMDKNEWKWKEGDNVIPVILPRTYINIYNFGFAQNHDLPKISEDLMGMIDIRMLIRGNQSDVEYKGRVVGLSSSLSSILIPQSFMDWSNKTYSSNPAPSPNRLLVKVTNPADKVVSDYFEDKGYEMDTDKLEQEKMTYFLRLIVTIVLVIGIIISILSFYILMLSIYLLVQKNTTKLQNLLLIGYTPNQVARPYHLLTFSLNALVLALAFVVVFLCRSWYIGMIDMMYPDVTLPSMLSSIVVGLALYLFISLLNFIVIRRKVIQCFH